MSVVSGATRSILSSVRYPEIICRMNIYVFHSRILLNCLPLLIENDVSEMKFINPLLIYLYLLLALCCW